MANLLKNAKIAKILNFRKRMGRNLSQIHQRRCFRMIIEHTGGSVGGDLGSVRRNRCDWQRLGWYAVGIAEFFKNF